MPSASELLKDFPSWPPALQEFVLNGPALPPPNGTVPNFVNPPNRNYEAIIVAVICLVISAAAFLCRVYARIFIAKKVDLQDYLGLAAFLSYIALVWVYFDFLHRSGFYVNQWNIRYKDVIPVAKTLAFGLPITYSATLLFAKTAILLEWIRIFSPYRGNPFFYWASYTMIVLNILLYIGSIVSSAITCIPHEVLWQPWVEGHCIDRKALGIFTAFFNVIMDLVILILPQRIIWGLQMTVSRRVGFSLIFSVGVLATVCAAGRVAVTFDISYDGDATYTVAPILIWALPELTCVLLVFCMPAIPKVFTPQGPLFRMASYIRSWTRLSTQASRNPQTSAKAATGWVTTPGKPPAAHVYDVMEDNDKSISIAELKLIRGESRKGDVQLENLQPLPRHTPTNSEIIKTTEVEQRKYSASSSTGEPWVERQHPWMKK